MDDPQLSGSFWDQYGPMVGLLILFAVLAATALVSYVAKRIRRARRRRAYYAKLQRQEASHVLFRTTDAEKEEDENSVIV
jgi:peptidoglycan/LPS O-acetylase OafA/YrhL